MRALKELVDYVSPQRLRRTSFFQRYGKLSRRTKPTQTQLLYELVHSGEVESDAGASLKLFGDPKDKRYPVLKHKLKEELFNAILLAKGENDWGSEYERLFTLVKRRLTLAQVLRRVGAFKAMGELALKALKDALEAELSEEVVICCNLLVSYYAFQNIKPERVTYYRNLSKIWHRCRVLEYEIENVYWNIPTIRKKTISEADQSSLDVVESFLDNEPSPICSTIIYGNYYYFIVIAKNVYSGRYNEASKAASLHLEFLGSKKIVPEVFIRNVLFQLISITLIEGDLKKCVETIHKGYKVTTSKSRPWFRIKQFHTVWAIYSSNYTKGVELINEVFSNKKTKTLAQDLKIRFRIIQAHLKWLEEMGELDGLTVRLRAPRVIRRLPAISKDKEGFNIPFLIVQALLAFSARQWLQLEKRMEELEAYAEKYLRGKAGLQRVYLFIKSIAVLKTGNRHPIYFKRHSQAYYDQLLLCTRAVARQNSELEIIPYEHIYQLILRKLEQEV